MLPVETANRQRYEANMLLLLLLLQLLLLLLLLLPPLLVLPPGHMACATLPHSPQQSKRRTCGLCLSARSYPKCGIGL